MRQLFKKWLKSLRKDRRGVTAIEYALLAALMVVAVSIFMPGVGTNLSRTFSNVSIALRGPPPPCRYCGDG